MKWTIRLEFTPDGNEPRSMDVGTITRPPSDLLPEDVGLTLEEGRQILQRIEREIIGHQVHAYAACNRRCRGCGKRQRIKDVRTKCVQTVFGAYRLRGHRYRACQCLGHASARPTLFPLGEMVPRRTTPEVRFMFAELGARMPYREASRVLRVCGFGRMRASYSTIRRHTLGVGVSIHWDHFRSCVAGPAQDAAGVESIVVGIDDTYIRHHRKLASRQIQVTAGRFERNGALGQRFAFVAQAACWRSSHFAGVINEQGRTADTAVRVVNDGDTGLRNFVQNSIGRRVESQLDWFHIGMRLERLRKVVRLPVTYAEYLANPTATKSMEKLVDQLRDALWRGRSDAAMTHFDLLRTAIDDWQCSHTHTSLDSIERAHRNIDDFQGYVCGNRRSVPDFAKARAAGRRISTAHVESVMNHLVNHRMSKKQQMRWSPTGAHLLLQVRAEALNGTLLDRFRNWFPRFRGESRFVPCNP